MGTGMWMGLGTRMRTGWGQGENAVNGNKYGHKMGKKQSPLESSSPSWSPTIVRTAFGDHFLSITGLDVCYHLPRLVVLVSITANR